jgi:hypothetical protein
MPRAHAAPLRAGVRKAVVTASQPGLPPTNPRVAATGVIIRMWPLAGSSEVCVGVVAGIATRAPYATCSRANAIEAGSPNPENCTAGRLAIAGFANR